MKNGIKFYREKAGKTQQEIADHLSGCNKSGQNVPRSRISMLENGEAIPKAWEVENMATFLDVTPGHLYTQKQIEIIYLDAREDAKVDLQGGDC